MSTIAREFSQTETRKAFDDYVDRLRTRQASAEPLMYCLEDDVIISILGELNHLTAHVEEARRLVLEEARLAYESHYASTPGGSENCDRCGANWRDPIHLRSGETVAGRIERLTANPVRTEEQV